MTTSELRLWLPAILVVIYLARIWYRMRKLKSPEADAMMEAFDRSEKLRETNPAAADRLLLEEATRWQADRDSKRDALRARARLDPEARSALRKELASELRDIREVTGERKWWSLGPQVELNATVRNEMEKDARALEAEIATLDRL